MANNENFTVREMHQEALNDQGNVFKDSTIFVELERFFNDIGSLDADWEQELQRGSELVKRYETSFDESKFSNDAVQAKYYIVLGRALNRVQALLNKLNREWTAWVEDNLSVFSIRTASQPIKVSRLANVTNYIIFGIDRLKEIAGYVGDLGGDNPVGDFLARHGISFSPDQDTPVAELLVDVDTALTFESYRQNGFGIIPKEKIHQLVQLDLHKDPKASSNLQILKENGRDIPSYLDMIIQAKKIISTPELDILKKLSTFNKLGKECRVLTAEVKEDENLRSNIDHSKLDELIENLNQLKQSIVS